MINGAHVVLYSADADADRVFFRDTLEYSYADAGRGWLIFALPPAELAIHPAERGGNHELHLMCDDVHAFIADMKKKGVACEPVSEQRWGLLTRLTLPSGAKLGVYEPRHPSPIGKRAAKTTTTEPTKRPRQQTRT
jgi:hypothetical protein